MASDLFRARQVDFLTLRNPHHPSVRGPVTMRAQQPRFDWVFGSTVAISAPAASPTPFVALHKPGGSRRRGKSTSIRSFVG